MSNALDDLDKSMVMLSGAAGMGLDSKFVDCASPFGFFETERRGDSAASSAKNNMRRVAKLIRASSHHV